MLADHKDLTTANLLLVLHKAATVALIPVVAGVVETQAAQVIR